MFLTTANRLVRIFAPRFHFLFFFGVGGKRPRRRHSGRRGCAGDRSRLFEFSPRHIHAVGSVEKGKGIQKLTSPE